MLTIFGCLTRWVDMRVTKSRKIQIAIVEKNDKISIKKLCKQYQIHSKVRHQIRIVKCDVKCLYACK